MAEGSEQLERKFELLWGPRSQSARGRPASSSVDEIVNAAILIARNAGLDKVTMRRVAATVGMGTMTLYTYVPGREELVELMIDHAYSQMDLPEPDSEWRPALTQYAQQHYEMYLRDSWLLQTSMLRAPLAPAVLDAQEAGLRALINTGLEAVEVVEIVTVVDTVVQGLARMAIVEQQDQRETGISADAYWEGQSEFWEKWFDVNRYPTTTQVYMAGGFDTVGSFESSLGRLLIATEEIISRAQSG